MRDKVEVPAVKDNELRTILSRFGLAKDLAAGSLRCGCCGRQLTWENIGALTPENKSIKIFCDSSGCIEFASERARK